MLVNRKIEVPHLIITLLATFVKTILYLILLLLPLCTTVMSNTMTAHEPINYLDSIINEEEKRCEYSHQWRNFTISRSGRFKSKNKHRNVVDGKVFDRTSSTSSSSPSGPTTTTASSASTTSSYDKDKKISSHYGSSASKPQTTSSAKTISSSHFTTSSTSNSRQRDKVDSYKSYYETNL